MDVKYAIVKVYITECNDVIKHLSNVIIIWQTPAIEVKKSTFRIKGVQEKESVMGVRGR